MERTEDFSAALATIAKLGGMRGNRYALVNPTHMAPTAKATESASAR